MNDISENTAIPNFSTVAKDDHCNKSQFTVLEAQSMAQHFGNKHSLLPKAKGFAKFSLVSSYNLEEETFTKIVR